MLKQLLNEGVIDLVIEVDGPILIKSGHDTVRGPNMAFVKTWRNGSEEVYLPGSSLKGVLRSHAERITRTLQPAAACDPFVDIDKSRAEPDRLEMLYCGHRFKQREKWRKNERNEYPRQQAEEKVFTEKFTKRPLPPETFRAELTNPELYAYSCPICRLFGSTYYGGRLATADAYAVDGAPRPEQRDGVGIDRFTGGAANGAKFNFEVITQGRFETSLHLRNFELWQLGLVGFLLEDLKAGLIRVGMGKSRGLGKVKGQVTGVRLDFLGRQAPQPENGRLELRGLGSLSDLAKPYGVVQPDVVKIDFAGAPDLASNIVRTIYRLGVGETLWPGVAQAWGDYILREHTVPAAMNPHRFVEK
jgi:CRISPR-associated RAMP protein (TIGR02581 family)